MKKILLPILVLAGLCAHTSFAVSPFIELNRLGSEDITRGFAPVEQDIDATRQLLEYLRSPEQP